MQYPAKPKVHTTVVDNSNMTMYAATRQVLTTIHTAENMIAEKYTDLSGRNKQAVIHPHPCVCTWSQVKAVVAFVL